MRVLFIVGTCLTKNTSANMSHNAFIQGFIENQCDVDIIMESDSWGTFDSILKRFDKANYYEYNSVSLSEKLRKRTRNVIQPVSNDENGYSSYIKQNNHKLRIRAFCKSVFYKLFDNNSIYGNDDKWLKTAMKFHSDIPYDLVVSNSSPAASHKLAKQLIERKHISTKRWLQIWEDPWSHDLYSGGAKRVIEEEHNLLSAADEIYYVSPLTAEYQKKYFPDCAEMIKCIPLPFLNFSNSLINQFRTSFGQITFGYFGDYYSVTRNLLPFYNALVESGFNGSIYGDNDLNLKSTERITVSGRVTLDVLAEVQKKTDVLVHLSNLKGGQIPGKIYHYSATTKPILFILDGTQEEKDILREFFGKYNRYYFCENNKHSILETLNLISLEKNKKWDIVRKFSPKAVVSKLI